jgi:hypothetical protein
MRDDIGDWERLLLIVVAALAYLTCIDHVLLDDRRVVELQERSKVAASGRACVLVEEIVLRTKEGKRGKFAASSLRLAIVFLDEPFHDSAECTGKPDSRTGL